MTAPLRLPLVLLAGENPGRGLVRLPFGLMTSLGLRPGDTVEITGRTRTYARVIPARTGEIEIGTDAQLITNVGASAGDVAEIRPAPLSALNSAIVRIDSGVAFAPDDLREALFDLPMTVGDRLVVAGAHGRRVTLSVIDVSPGNAGLFATGTLLTMASQPGPSGYEAVGGLDEVVARIHEMVATPLLRPDLFAHLGIPPPRGVLFTGPPGSGKTLLARTIAKRTSAAFFQINAPEIVSKHYGESEAALRKVFEAAAKAAPAIIFIDEIDAIAPKRDSMSGEKQLERRVVAQLLTLMDGLSDRGGVIVMGATNLPDSLDSALRRPGRFDREIQFTPPNAKSRRAILDIHLARAPLAADVDLDAIAAAAHGYVGADLAALAREASLAALDRAVAAAGGEDRVKTKDLHISQFDLLKGLRTTSPSALRETMVHSPPVGWQDIGGLEDIKDTLIAAVVWPLLHRESFAALNLAAARGVLLSGPPGTGKTLLARALAQESGMNFIAARPTQILSQFLGEAERAIATIFARARQSAPTLIFFDELDTLAPRRSGKDGVADRIVAQLLTEIDGVQPNDGIVVLGATNRSAAIDPALLRAGRFELTIAMPLPNTKSRHEILDLLCRNLPCQADVSIKDLVPRTDGFSGADLSALVNGAARHALSRALRKDNGSPQVTAEDFDLSLQERERSRLAAADDFIHKEY